MRTITRRVFFFAGAAVASCARPPAGGEDRAAIEALLHGMFDRTDAPLDVGPIAVGDSHAVADWTQQGTGGRALLKKRGADWALILCSGDALRSAEGLAGAGISEAEATRLAVELARLERGADPARLQAMALFEGTVRMDGASR